MPDSNPLDNFQEPPLDWHAAPEGAALVPKTTAAPGLLDLPLRKAILGLALPAIASMLFIMLFNLVDAWWVGKLGAEPLAGVSAASFIFWALESAGILVSTGVSALVAQRIGAGRTRTAGVAAGQGLIMAILLGLLLGIFTYLVRERVFDYMGLADSVRLSARHYTLIIAAGLFLTFSFLTIESVFRGSGDTRTPLKIVSGALTLNAILDPFFIFGIGPFPRLEAAGAALATIIAHGMAAMIGILVLQKRRVRMTWPARWRQKIQIREWMEIARIGAPIAVSGIMFSISYIFLTRVITHFGAAPLAALGLGHRIEGLTYFTAVGFSVAASTLVGQNLGAGRVDKAEQSAWLTLAYASLCMLVLSVFFYVFGREIVSFFIDDAIVEVEGMRYLKIIAVFEVFLAFEIVLEGAFSGAGHSLPPMLISVPLTWLRIPLSLYLAHELAWGSAGIWWAISMTTAAKGVILALWFKRGSWKTLKNGFAR